MKYKISIFLMLVIMGISQLNGQKLTNFNFLGVKTFYQDETRISKKQFVSLLSNNTEAYKTWQKSNRNKYIGLGLIVADFGFVLWQLNSGSSSGEGLASVIGLGVASIGFRFSSIHLNIEKHSDYIMRILM